MTVGSSTFDNRFASTYTYDGVTAGNTNVGSLRSKTWSGSDSWNPSTPPRELQGERFVVSRLDRKGRSVEHSFVRHNLRREKNLPPNPYTMSSTYADFPPCGAIITPPGYGSHVYSGPGMNMSVLIGTGLGYLPNPPSWGSNDEIALIGKLAAQTKGSEFNMGIFLGEGHKTVTMIGDSAVKLARAYTLLRKGDVVASFNTLYNPRTMGPRRAPSVRTRSLKGLSGSWLEMQYGWMPLLQDMKAGAELLSHQLHVPFRSRQSVMINRRISQADINNFNLAYTLPGAEVFTSKRIVAFFSEPPSIPVLSGLKNPELIAWELIPFSFVADWIAPIGDYMEARAFLSHVSGTFVSTLLTKRSASSLAWKSIPGAGAYRGGGSFRRGTCTVVRTVSDSLRVPPPAIKPLSEIASWKHCTNALALLTQAVKLR